VMLVPKLFPVLLTARSLIGTRHKATVPCMEVLQHSPEEIAPGCNLVWLEAVDSTQDEAKRYVPLPPGVDLLGIGSNIQLKGRGTRGRDWLCEPGNMFLTMATPMAQIPVTLTLTPLKVGSIVAKAVQTSLIHAQGADDARVTLKWPNDVLVNEKKVGGILVEGDGTYLFVGVGVNVANAPGVPNEGPQRGRPSTCLAEHGLASSPDLVKALAVDIARQLGAWVQSPMGSGSEAPEHVREEWTGLVDWTCELTLRDDATTKVSPLRLEADGSLLVRNLSDGSKRLLIAEYLH